MRYFANYITQTRKAEVVSVDEEVLSPKLLNAFQLKLV